MRLFRLEQFGLDHFKRVEADAPQPGPGEVAVDVRALSLNYRDLLVIKGVYNPKLALPAVPISDGAGVVAAVGDGVTGLAVGDRVVTHFIAGWQSGPFRGEYSVTSLGTPGPGMAAERVVLPVDALLPIPQGLDFAQAATLPIAALTAWSALFTEGGLQPGDTVLTLGTGGVSIFAVQLAKAAGATAIITSSSDDKLGRARELGADHGINYVKTPEWDSAVLAYTGGAGADIVVETGGAGTLTQSLRAAKPGGVVGFLGALTGLQAEVNLAFLLMKRLRLAGIYVDSRASFEAMLGFLDTNKIEPVIDRRFGFDELPDALRHMESGGHFGKIVVDVQAT